MGEQTLRSARLDRAYDTLRASRWPQDLPASESIRPKNGDLVKWEIAAGVGQFGLPMSRLACPRAFTTSPEIGMVQHHHSAARLCMSQLANLPLTIRQGNRTTRIFKNGLAAAGFHHTTTTLINPAHRHTVGQPLGLRQIMRHHQNRIPPL